MAARRFENVLSTLRDILSAPKNENVQELARLLTANRPAWLELGEWPSKKESERRDLERERLFRIRCLQEIWRGALMSIDESQDGYEVKMYLEEFTRSLEAEMVVLKRGETAKGKWHGRIWGEIEKLGDWENQIKKEMLEEKKKQGTLVPSASTSTSAFGAFSGGFGAAANQSQGQASTSTTTSKPPQSLSETTQSARVDLIQTEKKELAYLLNLIAFGRRLNKDVMLKMLNWLCKAERGSTEGIVVPILLTFIIQFDTSNTRNQSMDGYEEDESALPPEWMLMDVGFLQKINETVRKSWKPSPTRAVFLLQWSLYLVYASVRREGLERQLEFYAEDILAMAERAILDGALTFIAVDILSFRKQVDDFSLQGTSKFLGENGQGEEPLESLAQRDLTIEYLRRLITMFITVMINVIRKLKNREEDLISGSVLSSSQHGRPKVPENSVRHDTAMLFHVVGLLYKGDPDSAIEFWNDDEDEKLQKSTNRRKSVGRSSHPLTYFIRWGVDCRDERMMSSFCSMLAFLAEGPRCAGFAFRFLNPGNGGMEDGGNGGATFSWKELFAALQFYAEHTSVMNPSLQANSSASFNSQSTQHTNQAVVGEMPPLEVMLQKSFLELLTTVVRYSPIAKMSLWDNQRYRPVQTLFALLVKYIPVDLKAKILEAIAAFAEGNWDITKKIWIMLEDSQVLISTSDSVYLAQTNSFLSRSFSQQPVQPGGVLAELDDVETPNKTYPGSTAFINLLGTLIHKPQKLAFLKKYGDDANGTIPYDLGSGRRRPGVEPFVDFVLQDVFLKIKTREYRFPQERWKVTEKCLRFFERCLATYNLESHLKGGSMGGGSTDFMTPGSPLALIVNHPGFDLMLKFLGDSPLLSTVFDILADGLAQSDPTVSALLGKSVLRCMRILFRISELQEAFIEVVVPTIRPLSSQLSTERINALGVVVPLEQHFLYSTHAVVNIAHLVNPMQEPETALLAVKMISAVSKSPIFKHVKRFPDAGRTSNYNTLLGLIQASDRRDDILAGFMECVDDDLLPNFDGIDLQNVTVADESVYAESDFPNLIRSEIMELLISNTLPYCPGPNIAHFLLGFKVKPGQIAEEIQLVPQTIASLLDLILALLYPNSLPAHATITTIDKNPNFSEQCYRLIRQLCTHDYSSAVTIRYLYSNDNFLLRQLHGTPFQIPQSFGFGKGKYTSTDRSVDTTANTVAATLLSEAELLESIALKLNYFLMNQQTSRATELLSSLFSQIAEREDGDMDVAQTLPRILEIFFSLDFQWHDSLLITSRPLILLAGLPMDNCIKSNDFGCDVYDMKSLDALLSMARRHLRNSGRLGTQPEEEAFCQEAMFLLQAHSLENHRRIIQFSRHRALRAWKNLLDLSLSKSLNLLPIEGRHGLLLDLMMAVLPPLINGALEEDNALLSDAAVLLMMRLRDEGVRLASLEEPNHLEQADVSIDRLHRILRSIVQAIAISGQSIAIRVNLYTILLNYLQYSLQISTNSSKDDNRVDELALDDDVSTGFFRSKPHGSKTVLGVGNMKILQSSFDKLLPLIARDATMGSDIAKTLAFTLLDVLTLTASRSKQESVVISILTKQGYINAFSKSFKETEGELFEVLKPDPESLNAIYVYEAKMAFLLRLSSSREGAERLLEVRIFENLITCDFLSAQPIPDPNEMMVDTFIPPVLERHYQLLLPALQLASSILCAFPNGPPLKVRSIAWTFIQSQREIVLASLRDALRPMSGSRTLRKARLVVFLLQICYSVVPEDEMSLPSKYGAIHTAVLNLAAKALSDERWIDQIQPSTEDERAEAQQFLGVRNEGRSVFQAKVTGQIDGLQNELVAYLNDATRRKDSPFRPVLKPTNTSSTATGPTLGLALKFLITRANDLALRLRTFHGLHKKLSNFDSLSLPEIEEVLGFKLKVQGNIANCRREAAIDIASMLEGVRRQALSSLYLVEQLLLLVWGHLHFWVVNSESPASNLRQSQSLNHIDLATLRAEVIPPLRTVFSVMEQFELSSEAVGPTYKEREAFVQTLLRKIMDITPSLT